MRIELVGGLAALLSGCVPDPGGADAGAPVDDGGVTTAWTMPERARCVGAYEAAPTVAGHLADPHLVETSGVVASPTNPGVLWLHIDGPGGDHLYAAGVDGRGLAVLTLAGVDAVDVEDLAAAPCPDRSGPCLWLADTGNNDGARTSGAVVVVREPLVSTADVLRPIVGTQVWTLPIRIPGAAADVEAMVVAPDAQALWLIEKTAAATARVFEYRAPFREDVRFTIQEVARFPAPGDPAVDRGREVTGADLHPTGQSLALRVHAGLFEYRFGSGQGPADLDVVTPALVVGLALDEPQGEAVGYDEAGTGLWTVSEDPAGLPGQPLHHVTCR